MSLDYGASVLLLCMRDDGIGIAADILASGLHEGHWRLRGLRERAAAMSAQLDIELAPGQGTTLCLKVPAPLAYAGQGAPDRR